MRKTLSFVTIFLLFLSLAGCFQASTLVRVKPDGSGTIEETFLMSKELVEQMKAMEKQMSGAFADGNNNQGKKKSKGKDKEAFSVLNVEELKKKADELGEGTTYVSSKKVITDKYEGYKAVYAFKDINKLKLNQNPGGNMPSSQDRNKDTDSKKELIAFRLTKGNPSKLVVKMPEEKPVDKPEESKEEVKQEKIDDPNSEMVMAQMKKMFDGMKIGLAVEVMGTIVQTNATHREGSRVTLIEMDFGKLFAMPEELKKFSTQKPDTIENAKKLMKDIPGIKVELNKEVTIDFR